MPASHGNFFGTPKTEWLVANLAGDREMRLLEDFSFKDPKKRIWLAPKGSIINGASIPRPLWCTVGSPYTDDYRQASIVHDVACIPHMTKEARKAADEMFYHACIAGGCGYWQAKLLYAGVRIGAWTSRSLAHDIFSSERMLFRAKTVRHSIDEEFVQQKFDDISEDVRSLPEDATIEQLDAAISKHLNI